MPSQKSFSKAERYFLTVTITITAYNCGFIRKYYSNFDGFGQLYI